MSPRRRAQRYDKARPLHPASARLEAARNTPTSAEHRRLAGGCPRRLKPKDVNQLKTLLPRGVGETLVERDDLKRSKDGVRRQ